MALLGWRGAGGLGAAETALYFFFGGVLMIVGGVLVRNEELIQHFDWFKIVVS